MHVRRSALPFISLLILSVTAGGPVLCRQSGQNPDTVSIDSPVDDVFREFDAEVEATHAFFRDQVESVWNEFRESTRQTWVEYSEDINALNEVDFKEGTVSLEAVVPVAEDDTLTARKRIVERLKTCLSSDNNAGVVPLDGQVAFSSTGESVDRDNADQYFRSELKDRVKKERIESSDGVSRFRYRVSFDLIPDHVRIRAEQYIPEVMEYSRRYGVRPELVLAVIHTESWFNPLAVSHAGAFGLMQLIPRYGGRDSYQFVFGKSWVPTEEYLYDSKNNIQLGTAYLHLLQGNRLSYRKDDEKKKYLVICAYNWGMGSINRKIIAVHDIDTMSPEELAGVIRRRAPKETSDYLERVLKREKMYASMFE